MAPAALFAEHAIVRVARPRWSTTPAMRSIAARTWQLSLVATMALGDQVRNTGSDRPLPGVSSMGGVTGYLEKPDITSESAPYNERMRNWARKHKNTDAIDVEMKAGAVVIWLGATWHAGGCLHGRKRRPAARGAGLRCRSRTARACGCGWTARRRSSSRGWLGSRRQTIRGASRSSRRRLPPVKNPERRPGPRLPPPAHRRFTVCGDRGRGRPVENARCLRAPKPTPQSPHLQGDISELESKGTSLNCFDTGFHST